MRNIPVDPCLSLVFVGVTPQVRNGEQVMNRDGAPMMVVSCIVLPSVEEGKIDTVEIRVPASGVPKSLAPYSAVKFQRLSGRAWAIDGRSGVSFTADAVGSALGPKESA
jgi:hypothetical protein